MIAPCNACSAADGNGSMSFAPVPVLPLSQRTNFTAQIPGTSNVPTQSGEIASTFPMPGTIPGLQPNMPETIPGQPDPPLNLNPQPPAARPPSVNPPPVLPEAPRLSVPPNPLLPPGYQDFIDYENLQYLNGFLRTQIGKYMRVEQLVGSSNLEDRYGYLIGVGINYILLQEIGTGNIMAIDYYGIKSVYVYFNQTQLPTNRQR